MRDNRLKLGVDIVLDLLKEVADAYPTNQFAQSILMQYQERGGLSKKQLEGLYGKAQKLSHINPAKMATLEAIILKKPTKEKTPALKEIKPLYEKDETAGKIITAILTKYPAHKRVLYFQLKYKNNETLTSAELTELQKFGKTLL